MQADRVFLHVGHSKTGTTTVQRTFRESHRLLADNGVLYSRAFRHHRRLRDFIRGDKEALAMERGFRRELRTLRPSTVVFSSEFLNQLKREERTRLIAYLAQIGREVKVLIYVRHPLDYARSSVQQAVRKLHRPLNDAIERAEPNPIAEYLRKWQKVAGRGNLIVREYHRAALVDGDIVQDMLAQIGRPELGPLFPRSAHNVSLSVPALQIAGHLIEHRELFDGRVHFLEAIAGPAFRLPEAAAQRISDEALLDLDYLEREWGMALRPPVAPLSSVEEPVLTAETARAIADGFVALARLQEKSAKRSEFSGVRRRLLVLASRLLRVGRGRRLRRATTEAEDTATAVTEGTAAAGTLSPDPGSSAAP
jgi:hypothetical protein